MPKVSLRFLDRSQVEKLSPEPAELLRVVEAGLSAHGRGEVVMPPKSHLHLDHLFNGHFNILTGYVAPVGRAGVKVVGDYVDNWRRDLPSEIAMLTLYDPATGAPCCVMDATSLTWQRTGATTAIGAAHLARREASIVGHIGARGTAFSNLRLLASQFRLTEVRICSRRAESRERLAQRVEAELGVAARAVATAAEAAAGADIVVEATRLAAPTPLLHERDIASGALLVTYGWVRAVDADLPLAMDKLVVDDWEQCTKGGSSTTSSPLARWSAGMSTRKSARSPAAGCRAAKAPRSAFCSGTAGSRSVMLYLATGSFAAPRSGRSVRFSSFSMRGMNEPGARHAVIADAADMPGWRAGPS